MHNTELSNDFMTETSAYKAVYSDAHGINKAGRQWTKNDIAHCGEKYGINPDKVEAIFTNVFKDNQDEFNIDDAHPIKKLEVWLKKSYDLQYNEVSCKSEYKKKKDIKWIVLNEDELYRQSQHIGLKAKLSDIKSLMKSEFMPTINPFVDYFNLLPKWDGIDHIQNLANYLQTDDQEFFITQFKKALVRSIACSVYGDENRMVFTLIQPDQNKGKSRWIRFLSPFPDKQYITEASLIGNTDSELRLSENFIYNLEELASLSNMEINKFKAIISKCMIKQRRAYGTHEETKPRRCNFWASTNKADFLVDTQNTRWLCFKVLSVNWDYDNAETGIKNIDIHKVWAQAWHLYHDKFNYQLTKEEQEHRDIKNKDYEIKTSETDLIYKYYRPSNKNDIDAEFMNATDILLKLMEKTDNRIRANKISIGKSLTQLGYYSTRNNGVDGYWIKPYLGEPVHPIMGTQQAIRLRDDETEPAF